MLKTFWNRRPLRVASQQTQRPISDAQAEYAPAESEAIAPIVERLTLSDASVAVSSRAALDRSLP